jgi:septal ring factor EnvC (AmiA/AmiB activator)
MARLATARQSWIAERDASATELQALAANIADREQALARQKREWIGVEQRIHADRQALAQSQLRFDADQARTAASLAEQTRQLEAQRADLIARDRRLTQREFRLNELLRLWGRRRKHAIDTLNQAIQDCLAERGEWSAARDAWLREYEHAIGERRELASRMLAIEQVRAEALKDTDQSPVMKKRLERIERHWIHQFDADVRELDRLRDTLATEAARLDESAAQVRRERLAAAEQLVAADDRLAALEADQAALVTERSRLAESAAVERDGRATAESQILVLRDEVEGLSRLLIDSPHPIERAA